MQKTKAKRAGKVKAGKPVKLRVFVISMEPHYIGYYLRRPDGVQIFHPVKPQQPREAKG